MNGSIRAIRGAITAQNTTESIISSTEKLLKEIFRQNAINPENIISLFFSSTKDLNAAYPAVAARNLGVVNAGLMCFEEMDVTGSLRNCIRVLVHAETLLSQKEINHVYLEGAFNLRPDLKKQRFQIAIDGFAGTGKSTVAKALAKKLGFIYVDTGALYRAIGLYCIENGVDYVDENAVNQVLGSINVELAHQDGKQEVFLNRRNVTGDIRTAEAGTASSKVGAFSAVRAKLLDMQKELGEKHNVVMDGRDIGANILPGAQVKIFMDADLEERIRRRCGELSANGFSFDFEDIRAQLIQRDYQDTHREIAPLTKTEDAVYIDTTYMTPKEVVEKIMEIAEERGLIY